MIMAHWQLQGHDLATAVHGAAQNFVSVSEHVMQSRSGCAVCWLLCSSLDFGDFNCVIQSFSSTLNSILLVFMFSHSIHSEDRRCIIVNVLYYAGDGGVNQPG